MAGVAPLRKSRRLRMAYLREHVVPNPLPVVVDIGANPVHVPAYDHLLKSGACNVVGFEPQQEAFDILQKNAGPNETYVNAAVGRPGAAVFSDYSQGGFSSIYKLHSPSLAFLGRFLRQVGSESEVSVDLQAMDDLDAIPAIDLLKIDVQGAEQQIIESGAKKLSSAVTVIPELRYYRLYQDEPLIGELDVTLRNQGFVLHKFLPAKSVMLRNSQAATLRHSANKSQLVDGDAVYIRNMEEPEQWTSRQLQCLAVMAGMVFDSQDLAIRCLDLLVERNELHADAPREYAELLPTEMLAD